MYESLTQDVWSLTKQDCVLGECLLHDTKMPYRKRIVLTGSSLPSAAAAVRSRAYFDSASCVPSGFWLVTF